MASGGHRLWRLAAAAATLALAVACGSSGPGSGGATVPPRSYDPLCNFAARPPALYHHVIWIWFENTDEQDVLSASNADSHTSGLIDHCGLADNYHNITHPSLPNYVAATSGSVQGAAAASDCAASACPQSQTSIFDQLQASGAQWRDYVQSPNGICSDGPAAWYPSVAARCAQWEEPLGEPASGALHNDLASGALPAFAFVLPDGANDRGPPADHFLSDWITAIAGSPEYKSGSTAVLITWDEGGTNPVAGEPCDDQAHANSTAYPGCQVAMIAVAPATGASRSSDHFTHYSLLRTTEEMLGITTHLGHAATAPSMRAPLHL